MITNVLPPFLWFTVYTHTKLFNSHFPYLHASAGNNFKNVFLPFMTSSQESTVHRSTAAYAEKKHVKK